MMPVFRSNKATLAAGDSIESLFASLEQPLLAYAYKITAERESAQDLVQDAFLRFQQSETKIESPRAWLYRTVHNLSINFGKRKSRESSFEESEPELYRKNGHELDALPSEKLERNEMIGITRLLIEQLDKRSRDVVRMKFNESLSYKQISEKTGLSVSNVGYLLHQAVKSLSGEFEKLGLRK